MEESDCTETTSWPQHCKAASLPQQTHWSHISHSESATRLVSTQGLAFSVPGTLSQPQHRLPCCRKEVDSNIHTALTGLFPAAGGHQHSSIRGVPPAAFQDVSGRKGEQTADTSHPHAGYLFIQANWKEELRNLLPLFLHLPA